MPDATVTVRLDRPLGPHRPVWTWFGYDEPNYTTTANGRKLLARLAALSEGPVHVRTNNLLTSGDGTPALKWGSTNAYTEDAAGNPVHMGGFRGERLAVDNGAALPLAAILAGGVRDAPDLGALATRDAAGISVLLWNYHDDDAAAAPLTVAIALPDAGGPLRVTERRMDRDHANAYEAWRRMGAPQPPDADQVTALEKASELVDRQLPDLAPGAAVEVILARQAVVLLRLER